MRKAVLWPDGVVAGAARGLLIIDTTTARLDDSVALAAETLRRAEERGWRAQGRARFLEALRETVGLDARI